MKIKVRSNCFETNSSSMHSLVVTTTYKYYTMDEISNNIALDNDGVWKLYSEDDLTFGRSPFSCLITFGQKVRYAIASMCSYRNNQEEIFKRIEDTVHDIFPECTKIKLPRCDYDWDKIFYGYVDEDILTPFLEKEDVTLKDFLLNKKYIVIVDGDEYCVWDSLKKAGIIDEKNIEKEFDNSIEEDI